MAEQGAEDWQRFLVRTDPAPSQFSAAFSGLTICVTGAGGSIGSALVEALASARPASLILLDSSEQNLFHIERRLKAIRQDIPCRSILGSVEDTSLLSEVFSEHRPPVIFHSAACKHVGLLENNPFAAIRTNVLGTYNVAQAAVACGASKLVLVSTDKAVNPHSMMGASKRVAELLTLSLSRSACRMNVVRLVNVIGSAGSVVPLFLEQIRTGDPLTVTDAEASRYFLTMHEAVEAIMATGVAACEGKILLPAAGTPVRIVDLARLLVRHHGQNGHTNTPIVFTRLQPGEKLSEDLVRNDELLLERMEGPLTMYDAPRLSSEMREKAVNQLADCSAKRDLPALLNTLCSLVPDYSPSSLMRVLC